MTYFLFSFLQDAEHKMEFPVASTSTTCTSLNYTAESNCHGSESYEMSSSSKVPMIGYPAPLPKFTDDLQCVLEGTDKVKVWQ